MRVIYKPTGQIGDIPDDKFNPLIFALPQGSQQPAPAAPSAPAPMSPAFQNSTNIASQQQPQAQPQAQSQPQQDLASQIGGILGNILTSAAKPATDYKHLLGGFLNDITGGNVSLGEKLTPDEEKKLANPVEGLKRIGQVGAGLESFAIPFGKGAGVLSKAILPGAAVGALQGASDENATPQSVTGNAVLGGAGAGLLHGILGIPGATGKAGNAIADVGTSIRGGVNKIQVDPGIYGAGQEKAIQQTLQDLKIGGNPQQQYAKLLPAYQKLGDKIGGVLESSGKDIPLSSIKDDLYTNLAQNRTLDLSGKQAKAAVKNFVMSLNNPVNQAGDTVVPSSINTADLFKVKQEINQGYSQIVNKMRNGMPLSDQEKVLSVARKTIDDIIAQAHPDVKKMTVQQSHLYDAAESLASSRNRTMNASILGIGIPTPIAQQGQDLLGRAIQGVAKPLQGGNAVNALTSNPALAQILGQGGARGGLATGGAVNNIANNAQNPDGAINNQAQTNEVNNETQHTNSIQQPVNNSAPQDGQITPQMLKEAQLYLPPFQAAKIQKAYDAQFAAGKPPDPTDAANSKSGLNDLQNLVGMLGSDPNVLLKKSVPGAIGARQYKAAETDMLNNLIYLKTGKQASDAERKSYEGMLPQPGESKDTVNFKLKIFADYFKQRASGN